MTGGIERRHAVEGDTTCRISDEVTVGLMITQQQGRWEGTE